MPKIVDGKIVPDDSPSVTIPPSKFIVPTISNIPTVSDKQDKFADMLDMKAAESNIVETKKDKLEVTKGKAIKAIDQILADEQINAKVRSRVRSRIAQLWH